MMLNQTTRKQVDKVLRAFVSEFPTPEHVAIAEIECIEVVVKSLGFGSRRSKLIKEFCAHYVAGFSNIADLPGVGEYARRSHEIFCEGALGDIEPSDHALVKYWRWMKGRHTHAAQK